MPKQPEKPKKRLRHYRQFLTYSDELLRFRVYAVCQHLFAGDVSRFAKQFNLRLKRARQIFDGDTTVTVKVVAEILTNSSVRADWLLWGNGSMLDYGDTSDPKPGTLVLPDKIHSAFPVFNTMHSHPAAKEFEVAQFIPLTMPRKKNDGVVKKYTEVAAAIHRCCSHDRPVLFFIGPDAISAGAGLLVGTMLQKKYVKAVATTGLGLAEDFASASNTVDLNRIAQLAAQQGIGYGEAVGRWGFDPKRSQRERSLLYTAHSLGVPATVHIEIGELPSHLHPAARGAELGAAVGAATYADFLIFTELVNTMRARGGGLVIATGDVIRRSSGLLRQAANAGTGDASVPDVTFVSIDSRAQQYSDNECEDLRLLSDKKHILPGLYRGTVYNLINACDAIFSGKTFYDIEQS